MSPTTAVDTATGDGLHELTLKATRVGSALTAVITQLTAFSELLT